MRRSSHSQIADESYHLSGERKDAEEEQQRNLEEEVHIALPRIANNLAERVPSPVVSKAKAHISSAQLRRSSFTRVYTDDADAHLKRYTARATLFNETFNHLPSRMSVQKDEMSSRAELYERAMLKLQQQPELVDEIRRAKKYRRSSLIPQDFMKGIAHAEPDCGRRGMLPHLSRQKASENTDQFTIGYYDEGEKKKYPLNCSFGWYRWPFAKYQETDAGVLVEFGMGLAFYFKLVKSLIYILLFMNLCTLPSMIIYLLGNSIRPVQEQYYSSSNNQGIIGMTTVASLGSPFPVCMTGNENDVMSFICPGNAKIASVVAYYGQPRGSCTCPYNLQPNYINADPVCPGTQIGTVRTIGLFSNQLDYKDSKCASDSEGNISPCFLGTTRFDVPCCASTLTDTHTANLSSLSLAPEPLCNSYSAPYIMDSLCRGQVSCSIPVNMSTSISIPFESLASDFNRQKLCFASNATHCFTNLSVGGNFSACTLFQPKYMHMEAFCIDTEHLLLSTKFESAVANREISVDSITMAASVLDALSIIIFLLGIIWIRREQDYEEKEYNSLTCRASSYTVECLTIPDHDDTDDLKYKLKMHFETVLSKQNKITYNQPIKIADINLATRDYSYIRAACKRGQLSIEIDRILGRFTSRLRAGPFDYTSVSNTLLLNSLKKLMYKFELVNMQCERIQERAQMNILKAYITFESEEGFLRCLKAYPNVGFLSGCFQPVEVRRSDGAPIIIQKTIDPSDIKWENLGVPFYASLLRVLCTTVITILLLCASYVMIFEARHLIAAYTDRESYIHCDMYSPIVDYSTLRLSSTYIPKPLSPRPTNVISYADVLFDRNPSYYNQSSYGSQGYLLCYCQQINYERGFGDMQHYLFFNALNGQTEPWCNSMRENTLFATGVTYLATFIIMGVNLSLSTLIQYLVNFEAWGSHTYDIISLTMKLFFAQYVNTGLLSLIIYGDLSRAGGSSVNFSAQSIYRFGLFSGSLKDFDSKWYFSVGASLVFTMCAYVFGGVFANSCFILLNWLKLKWDKRTWLIYPITDNAITHCDVQTELDRLYVGVDFPMEYAFAATLTMLFVDMTYSPCMPILNIVCLLSLSLQYTANKYLLLRFHASPTAYTGELPKTMTRILFYAALLHCVIGVWMFGSRKLADYDFADRSDYYSLAGVVFVIRTHSWDIAVNWRDRAFGERSIILLAIGGAILTYLLLSSIWYFIYNMTGIRIAIHAMLHSVGFESGLFDVNPENFPDYFDSLPTTLLQWRIESKIIGGALLAKYKEVYSELKTGVSSPSDRPMTGLESYNICYAPEYSVKFGLDSNYIWRYAPKDWLIPSNSEVLHSRNPVTRKSLLGNIMEKEAVTRIFEDGKYEKEIDELLRYCSPLIWNDANGEVRVSMRKRNMFFSHVFDNNSQRKDRCLKTRLSIAAGAEVEFLNNDHSERSQIADREIVDI